MARCQCTALGVAEYPRLGTAPPPPGPGNSAGRSAACQCPATSAASAGSPASAGAAAPGRTRPRRAAWAAASSRIPPHRPGLQPGHRGQHVLAQAPAATARPASTARASPAQRPARAASSSASRTACNLAGTPQQAAPARRWPASAAATSCSVKSEFSMLARIGNRSPGVTPGRPPAPRPARLPPPATAAPAGSPRSPHRRGPAPATPPHAASGASSPFLHVATTRTGPRRLRRPRTFEEGRRRGVLRGRQKPASKCRTRRPGRLWLSSPPADLRRAAGPHWSAGRCGAPPLSPTLEVIPRGEGRVDSPRTRHPHRPAAELTVRTLS